MLVKIKTTTTTEYDNMQHPQSVHGHKREPTIKPTVKADFIRLMKAGWEGKGYARNAYYSVDQDGTTCFCAIGAAAYQAYQEGIINDLDIGIVCPSHLDIAHTFADPIIVNLFDEITKASDRAGSKEAAIAAVEAIPEEEWI